MDFEAARVGLLAWYAVGDQAGARQFMAWAGPVMRSLGGRLGLSGTALEDACQAVAGQVFDRVAAPLIDGQHACFVRNWLDWRLRDQARREWSHQVGEPEDPARVAEAQGAGPRPLLGLDVARLEAALGQLPPAKRAALFAYHWPNLEPFAVLSDRAAFAAASGRRPEVIEALLAQVEDADFRTSIRLLFSDARLEAAPATCQNTYSTNRRLGLSRLRALLKEGDDV